VKYIVFLNHKLNTAAIILLVVIMMRA